MIFFLFYNKPKINLYFTLNSESTRSNLPDQFLEQMNRDDPTKFVVKPE